jgi:O-antigen/teichoic acid export membrane protein
VFLLTAVSSVVAAGKDTIRGFERTDIAAFAHVGQHTLAALMALGALFLGGRLPSVLAVQVLAATAALLYVAKNLRRVGVSGFGYDKGALSELTRMGTTFVFSGVAMVLTPNIDALYLSKLAPEEVMGWYAVGRRLIGVLLFPASALIGALYPTLCRLFISDMPGFARATRGAIQSVSLLAIPLALGCGLYPEIGIMIFSREAFGPAEDNLRILAVYLLLVYVSMPLGTAIVAANMQKGWAVVQLLSVVVSLALDPLLIPLFQERYGNGGMGLCLASVLSEFAVVACGVAMSPKGIFDRGLWRQLGLGVVAGGAMIAVAVLLRSFSPFLGAPLSVVAYAGTLWFTGGIDRALAARALDSVRRRLGRKGGKTGEG